MSDIVVWLVWFGCEVRVVAVCVLLCGWKKETVARWDEGVLIPVEAASPLRLVPAHR